MTQVKRDLVVASSLLFAFPLLALTPPKFRRPNEARGEERQREALDSRRREVVGKRLRKSTLRYNRVPHSLLTRAQQGLCILLIVQ